METPPIIQLIFDQGLAALFYVLAVAFVIHAIIVSYHWITFGADRRYSILSIVVYLLVGSFLLLTLAVALHAT